MFLFEMLAWAISRYALLLQCKLVTNRFRTSTFKTKLLLCIYWAFDYLQFSVVEIKLRNICLTGRAVNPTNLIAAK